MSALTSINPNATKVTDCGQYFKTSWDSHGTEVTEIVWKHEKILAKVYFGEAHRYVLRVVRGGASTRFDLYDAEVLEKDAEIIKAQGCRSKRTKSAGSLDFILKGLQDVTPQTFQKGSVDSKYVVCFDEVWEIIGYSTPGLDLRGRSNLMRACRARDMSDTPRVVARKAHTIGTDEEFFMALMKSECIALRDW